jgi:signal transduction histidine kinase
MIESKMETTQPESEYSTLYLSTDSIIEGWIDITIADSGCGIPTENLEKIFQALFSTQLTGIGLGLSLVNMIVEAHGGIIEVQSEPEKCSTFKVRIPCNVSIQYVEV